MSCANAWSQLIPWKGDVLLVWSDFQAAPDPASNYAAYTAYSINQSWRSEASGKIIATTQCSFDKNKSWKKPEKNLTPKILQHEQIHFNIAEIYARKIRQAYSNYASTHKYDANTSADLGKIFKTLLNECGEYNVTYDNETNHSINEDKQKEWTTKVMSQLSELKAFELK